jgi:hypothetical protein
MKIIQELPILVGPNLVARIPFPMTEDDFDLMMATLNLWKHKLVRSEIIQASSDADAGDLGRSNTTHTANRYSPASSGHFSAEPAGETSLEENSPSAGQTL